MQIWHRGKTNAVEEELDELEIPCRLANVTSEANAVAYNGDGSTVGVFSVGFDFAHYAGVCGFLAAVGGDVIIIDGEEGVVAWDMLACSVRAYTNALAEATKFVGV